MVVLLRAVSAYNYNRGYYAGMAATADTVKAAESGLWSKVGTLTSDKATVWSVLMALNPNPRAAMGNCCRCHSEPVAIC